MIEKHLAENRVFVTSASSSIGRSTAIRFCELGTYVVIIRINTERLKETLSSYKSSENNFIVLYSKECEQIPKNVDTKIHSRVIKNLSNKPINVYKKKHLFGFG